MESKSAEILGYEAFVSGYSTHYNPYRRDGSLNDYCDWEKGWSNAKTESECGSITEGAGS